MVIGAFPVAKLGVLFIKQISKPLANIIKNRAKANPFFRTYVCMPPAQMYNYFEIKTKMWALNLGKPASVPALNEAMAIDLGANLLGEFIIFSIGAGVLLMEYQRQVRKDILKEEMVLQEKLELQSTLNELIFQVERQDTIIREMSRTVAEVEARPWSKILQKVGTTIYSDIKNTNSGNNTNTTTNNGNYNPERSLLFKALNTIENDIFNKNEIITEKESSRKP